MYRGDYRIMILTSGENLTGEVGGVATEVTLGLSFLANIEITIQFGQ